ncbi:MAG: ABC transporter ATP-binding protein [Planctomycetota bacterium]|nr:MAG: ABC transporter ATP-binding protein [Planctomycetota bacterium]
MIEVQSISKRFGNTQAVRDLSFRLEPGQIAGLLGPNGAGKSTTIRIITGFLAPDHGSVRIGTIDALDHPEQARASIGYLPESAPMYTEMRAMDFLIYRARLFGLARRAARRSAEQASDRCRLGAMAKKRISNLSKGYRQRVGLAAALVHDPSVLILDEPTNGLDPSQIREARSLIRELAADRTMLVSSHILPEIERTCDRVMVIVNGRLCADGPPDRLIEHAQTTLTIECRSDDAPALWDQLRTIAGVRALRPGVPGTDWTRAELTLSNPDLRDRIAEQIARLGIPVRELALKRPTLEDAFVELAEQTGGAQ